MIYGNSDAMFHDAAVAKFRHDVSTTIAGDAGSRSVPAPGPFDASGILSAVDRMWSDLDLTGPVASKPTSRLTKREWDLLDHARWRLIDILSREPIGDETLTVAALSEKARRS